MVPRLICTRQQILGQPFVLNSLNFYVLSGKGLCNRTVYHVVAISLVFPDVLVGYCSMDCDNAMFRPASTNSIPLGGQQNCRLKLSVGLSNSVYWE